MSPKIKPHQRPDSEKNRISPVLREFSAALTAWFLEFGRELPWRTPAPRDPYSVLVSELMLQQTQVTTVIDYYHSWMARFPDIATLAAAWEEEVLHAWQGLGYYSRARNLHAAARKIAKVYGGQFPRSLEQLRTLPGVGPYTAAAVATFAFDQPAPPVDGNILRVVARLLDYQEPVDTAAGLKTIHAAATSWQPATRAGLFNEALMELGALICTPRAPQCANCPVQPFCHAKQPETIPLKKPRPKTVEMEECCDWIIRDQHVLLEQQTGRRWRGLWRLPLAVEPHTGLPLATRVYPFTNHRITLSVFPATTPLFLMPNQQWFELGELAAIAMTAPHRRALDQLIALTFPPALGIANKV